MNLFFALTSLLVAASTTRNGILTANAFAISTPSSLARGSSSSVLSPPEDQDTTSHDHQLRQNPNFVTHDHPYLDNGSQTVVFEVPVEQDGIKMFIANDGPLQDLRPGNGGMRLMSYSSDQDAIADAVRLAEGMTRKHSMYNTGFSGAKLVVNHGSVDLQDVDRNALMNDCAAALQRCNGTIYTGCDINTNDDDMAMLIDQTPYVLAGIGSSVDTNVATAMSVIGSILGIVESTNEDIREQTFLVQGCGKVGQHVATELVRRGAKQVKTCDLDHDRAKIPGCSPLGPDDPEWFHQKVDFLVPCANSLAINRQVLDNMPPPRFVVGATNQPYASAEIRQAFDSQGSLHVPESISSAGAILADSIEWVHPALFRTVVPSRVYGWIRDLSQAKASSLLAKADNDSKNILGVVDNVYSNSNDPIGVTFPDWITTNSEQVDGTIVLGGGMAGTATAYANSKAGIKTLLIEQGSSLAPKTASSNGDSRMYRQMYSDGFFSKMQTTALKQWATLEEECGEKLLHPNGLLFYGEDTGETVEGSVEGARQTMKDLGLNHEYFGNGDDIASRFPALQTLGKPYTGVFEETAGHVRSSAACEAMARVASESSTAKCTTITSCAVTSIQHHSDEKVEVVLQDGRSFTGKSLVIAAGPWTNQILQDNFGMNLDLELWRIHWAHYEVDSSAEIPQAFFFRKESECKNDGGLYYCFPAAATESCQTSETGKKIFKVGVDFKTTKSIDLPSTMAEFSYDTMPDVLSMMDGFVKEQLNGDAKRVEDHVSPYTMTPDSYFCLDKLPGYNNVVLFSGGSGRAFKFAPLIGDCLSCLARGEENLPIDIERFSISRPGLGFTTTSVMDFRNTQAPALKTNN